MTLALSALARINEAESRRVGGSQIERGNGRERGREKAKRINKKDAELVKLMYPVDKKDLLSA